MRPDHAPDLVTPVHLHAQLRTLTRLERLYHAAHPDATLADFDRLVSSEFWEIGASGRRYSRAFARQVLANRTTVPAPESWHDDAHVLTPLGDALYQLTYTLIQPRRATLRASLWRDTPDGWQVVFHQGTVCM